MKVRVPRRHVVSPQCQNPLEVPFGKFTGQHIRDCPLWYARWLWKEDWVEDRFPELWAECEEILKEKGEL